MSVKCQYIFVRLLTYASCSPCIPREYVSHPPPVTQQWVITSPPHRLIVLVSYMAQLCCTCCCWNEMRLMAFTSKRADPARCSLPSPLRSAGWHSGWHLPAQLWVVGPGPKIGWLKPVACVVKEVSWGGQSASKTINLCNPSAEVFRIAQIETGVPFSKDCSCEMVL